MTVYLQAGRYDARGGSPARPGESECPEAYHRYCPGGTWSPAVNLYEDDRNYYLVADLAGVGSPSIDLEARDGKLILAGHRPTPPPPEVYGTLHLHHMEIDHGRFERILEMPPDINVDAIEAVYRTGQLLVTLPKR